MRVSHCFVNELFLQNQNPVVKLQYEKFYLFTRRESDAKREREWRERGNSSPDSFLLDRFALYHLLM